MSRIADQFGDTALNAITTFDLEDWIDDRQEPAILGQEQKTEKARALTGQHGSGYNS